MAKYQKAFSGDQLLQMLEANDNTPEDFSKDHMNRLLTLARQRADARGEDNALENGVTECLIGTSWSGFAQDEFGYHAGTMNVWAFGEYEEDVSASKNADLFSNTQVAQQGWIKNGDTRMNQIEDYNDPDYDNSAIGEMWIPEGAQQYMVIVELTAELIHGKPTLDDAF